MNIWAPLNLVTVAFFACMVVLDLDLLPSVGGGASLESVVVSWERLTTRSVQVRRGMQKAGGQRGRGWRPGAGLAASRRA